MKIKVAWVGRTKDAAIQALTKDYLKRISRYAEVEGVVVADEATLLRLTQRSGMRPAHTLILLDGCGKQLSSEEFASLLRNQQERNGQPLLFAIGPADGFSEDTRKSAAVKISLGKMTLAHELARVVLLEQLYRAFTILKGHPYHWGH
ncbi:MAG: rRNA methyltransferase [Acidobacteria bacterium]|nr:MAG: rRNA methyltransferase [Acidobacteriota bacterium]